MSINENTYEEYFLLYADKELSVAEKNMVEEFVRQHPGLEEEFLMLQQSILKPENIKLDDKKFLLKEEGLITENNYEEKFILYNDNELSPSAKAKTENFIEQDLSLKNEFVLLQQIKYQPDTSVIYPDKKSLLKKGEDVKIIPVNWLKALAAAALLGLGLWIGIGYLQKKNPEKVFVQNTPTMQSSKIDSVNKKKDRGNISVKEKKNIAPPSLAIKNVIKVPAKFQPSLKDNSIVNNSDKQNKSNNQKLPDPLSQENNVIAGIEPPGKIDPVIKTKPAQYPVDIATAKIQDIQNPSEANNLPSTASYKTNQIQKSDNYVFYNITDEQFNKSRVGVLFKKIKGVFDKKTLKEKIFKSENKEDNPIN